VRFYGLMMGYENGCLCNFLVHLHKYAIRKTASVQETKNAVNTSQAAGARRFRIN
jgi:hypothetical protein